MTASTFHEVTQLLIAWSKGDEEAFKQLVPLVHAELNQLARARLKDERKNHSLEPAALVNEAYIRLVNEKAVGWKNRAHFFAIASERMRQILVDHARRRKRKKRDAVLVSLSEAGQQAVGFSSEIIAVNEALETLAEAAPRQTRIVVLRYFGGLTVDEIAEVLKIAPRTVEREWKSARAWLYSRLRINEKDDA
jgi:RNA polymerase sigma-70 factor (ECF subfamily)